MPNDDLLEQPDDLEIGFEGKKKKKKKAPAAGEAPEVAAPEVAVAPVSTPAPAPTPAPAAAAPAEDDIDAAILGDDSFIKGKKKPKKKTEEEKKASETTAEPALDEDLVLKPTGRKKKPIDLDAFERELGEQDDDAGENSASHIEMNKDSADDEIRFSEPAIVSDDPWSGSDRDYTYLELVERVFRIIRQANPEAEGGKKRYTMIPPQVVREGTKKTVFANLSEICKRMHRQPEHVISFVFSELGTTGSVDGSQRLVIKGRFQPPQIETVLKSYIIEYVTCKICKSPDTILTKENRLTFMQCQACGAKRSVANIKTGFSAQIESRKKAM